MMMTEGEYKVISMNFSIYKHQGLNREFPGGSVLRAPHFHCRGHGLDPWSGN